jgi:hypothetical protein
VRHSLKEFEKFDPTKGETGMNRELFHIKIRSLLIAGVVLLAIPLSIKGIRYYQRLENQIPALCYDSIAPVYEHVDVSSLIHIANEQDALRVRNEIIQTIWKNGHLPTSLPSKITRNIPNPIPELKNVSSVDEIDINLPESGTPYQFNAVVYFFHPAHDANKLMIFHQGHADTLQVFGGFDTIQFFLNRGYSVLGFFMPLTGPNRTTNPSITARGSSGGNQMAALETETFNPLEIFLDPLPITLRYIKQNYTFSTISMIGISGGGWTTTLYAAIDPSIQYSYPVAGSLPLFLRTPPCNDSGSWEQSGPSLYKKVDYMDLYILGAYGKGRKQVQMLNHYDNCCFEGIRYLTYENIVKSSVNQLGEGEFDVFLDSSFRYDHKISLYALEHVFPPTS